MVRSRRRLPQRRAACRRALHAGESVPHDVRSHHRGPEGVHAPVDDPLPAVPPDGEERPAARIQVRAVHRGAPVRRLPQADREVTAVSNRSLAFIGVLLAVVAMGLVVPAAGQAPKKYTAPKTPWGDPDLQGVWNDATSTPLQRPGNVAEKGVLSDEEAEEFQKSLEHDLTRDRRDGGGAADVNRAYNEHWMDARRLKITADRRTSLIVDPVDGRIPPPVAASPERARVRASRAAGAARFAAGMPADVTDMSWPVRCVVRT